jgi:hypothetical protein
LASVLHSVVFEAVREEIVKLNLAKISPHAVFFDALTFVYKVLRIKGENIGVHDQAQGIARKFEAAFKFIFVFVLNLHAGVSFLHFVTPGMGHAAQDAFDRFKMTKGVFVDRLFVGRFSGKRIEDLLMGAGHRDAWLV